MEEPRRERGHDQTRRPPHANAEEPLERQHQGGRAQQTNSYRGGPGHEDRLAENRRRCGVDPHRQAEVEDAHVAEIDGSEHAFLVPQAICDQVMGEIDLMRLVAEEVDREIGDAPQPGHGTEEQDRKEDRPLGR